MADVNMLFTETDRLVIDEQDYDPKLHQKPFAWEDLQAGMPVIVSVFGMKPFAYPANPSDAAPIHGITYGGFQDKEVDVLVSNMSSQQKILVFKRP